MITFLKSNLFFSPAQVLVNTVNTQGVMGKGIAKEFKRLFPEMFIQYQSFCEQKKLQVGNLWLYKTTNKWVLNFPTKKSWRNPSKLEYIEAGLKKFVDQYSEKGIQSIAFPPLGCGNGELDWEKDVRPLMEKYLSNLPIDVYIHLYSPKIDDVPEHKHIKNVSKWLQSEPRFLSSNEVIDNLKNIYTFDKPDNLEGIELIFNDDDLVFIKDECKITWPHEDLVDFWSILRNHGLVSKENVPSSFGESFDMLVQVFSALPFLSEVEATTNYAKLDKQPIKALQLLPEQKESYDRSVAI